jgi:hypothetical protein
LAETQIGGELSSDFNRKEAESPDMLYVSEAIFRSALDQIAASKTKVLLIAGDLTADGARVSHEKIASYLKDLESRKGNKKIEVFVLPGIGDISGDACAYTAADTTSLPNVTAAEFKDIYADFGYSQAISAYEGTLSYSADIGKNYRLIAIDDCDYSEGIPAVTGGLTDWAAGQIAEAIKDKKIPIAMSYYPLTAHLGTFVETAGIVKNDKVGNSDEFAKAMNSAGLDYIFTSGGTQDIASYSDGAGPLYDISTGGLSAYPSPIRYVYSNNRALTFKTECLKKVDAAYIPSYASADSDALGNDFVNFSGNFFNNEILKSVKNMLSADLIATLLSAVGLENPEGIAGGVKGIFDNLLDSFSQMKIYGTDETTLETIAAEYGVTLPETGYGTVLSVVGSFIKANVAGDENFSPDSPETKLLKYSLYSLFYVLSPYYTLIHMLINTLPDVNLSLISENLFKTDDLDLVALNIGGLLSPLLSDLLGIPISSNVKAMLGTLKSLVKFEDILYGIKLQNYLDNINGSIKVGALLENILFDVAKDNLTVDKAPADNNIKINKKTLEAQKI